MFVCVLFKQQNVLNYRNYISKSNFLSDLMKQHPQRYSTHVEPIEKVLNVHVGLIVDFVRVLQLQHPLSHGLHNIVVTVLYGF